MVMRRLVRLRWLHWSVLRLPSVLLMLRLGVLLLGLRDVLRLRLELLGLEVLV
jgi:hypothetical protein